MLVFLMMVFADGCFYMLTVVFGGELMVFDAECCCLVTPGKQEVNRTVL